MKTPAIIILIIVMGFVVSLGCTTLIPEKKPIANGSIIPLNKIFGDEIIPGEPYTFGWSVANPAINEVRFWDFRGNFFIITTVPVDNRGNFEYSLSANETRTLPLGGHLFILQYPDKNEGFSIVYDNTTGEVVRLHEGMGQVLARINQSRQYSSHEVEHYLNNSLMKRVPEGTMFFAPVEVLSNDWLRMNPMDLRNFTQGELITLNGTTTVYPGFLLACVCNTEAPRAFISSGATTCCSDNIRRPVDSVNVINGSFAFSLVIDSTMLEPGNYTAQIWQPNGHLEVFSDFSVSNSTAG